MEYAYSVADVPATCIMCGTVDHAIVAETDFEAYCAGALVQAAFPEASVETREIIIGWRSGVYVCPAHDLGEE